MRFEDWWKSPEIQAKFGGHGAQAAQAAWNASGMILAELISEVAADAIKEIKGSPAIKAPSQKHRIGRWAFKARESWGIRGTWLNHPSGWKVMVDQISEPTIVRATKDSRWYMLFTASLRSEEWIAKRFLCDEIRFCKNPIQEAIDFVEGQL